MKTENFTASLKRLGELRWQHPSPKVDAEMQEIIDHLIKIGVYPKSTPYMEKSGATHIKMVEGWGPEWALFKEPLNCPHCSADLRDPAGPPFKREIGIEIRKVYDGVCYYQCPDCGGGITRGGKPVPKMLVDNKEYRTIFNLDLAEKAKRVAKSMAKGDDNAKSADADVL